MSTRAAQVPAAWRDLRLDLAVGGHAKGVGGGAVVNRSFTGSALARMLTEHEARAEKDGRYFLAGPTANGHRGERDAQGGQLVVLDFDHGDYEAERIHGALEGFAHAVHTTHRSRPGDRRYRAVVVIDKPLPEEARLRASKALAVYAALGGVETAPEAWSAAHLWYGPSCPPDAKLHAYGATREGKLVPADLFADLGRDLDSGRAPSNEPAAPEPERVPEVADALTKLDPDMPYPDWIRVGMALRAGLGDAGKPLWLAWSRSGAKYSPGTDNDPLVKWDTFAGSGVGLGTVLWMAEQAGWDPAPWRRPESAQEAFADVIEPVASNARIIPLTEVKRVRYEWLWVNRIAYGYITLTVGDPEVGKSIMLMDIVARLSAGVPLPGQGQLDPMSVILLNAEDGADDVIKGRIVAAGGRLANVYVLNVNGPGQVHLPDDVAEVEKLVERTGARLIVLDPLDTALPMKIDAHRAQHIRTALAPLWQMAKRRQAAVVAVVHMNKKTGDNLSAMQRIAGSVGLPAAARSTMFVVRANPADLDGPRQVVQDKASHARHGAVPTLQFKVASVPDPDFKGDTIAKVEWLDTVAAVDASTALQRARPAPRDEAVTWLDGRLAKGPVPVVQLQQEARAAGITDITLRRAKRDLGVAARKAGRGGWVWELETYVEEPGGST